jgi:nucleotide sugar dehydrogenase
VPGMSGRVTEFADPNSVVAVVGLGKIGLPLALHLVRHGRRVLGCDSNPQVVEGINSARNHIREEPGLDVELTRAVKTGRLNATLDTAAYVARADVILVVVPAIVDACHEVDYQAIDTATQAIAKGLAPGKLVIYETTLPVGTTARRLRRVLETNSQLEAGRDFYLAYSPERVSCGRIFRDLEAYPKVVGGIDAASAAAAASFYRSVLTVAVISMESADEAEFVKLIETTYRDVNIALANEFAQYADRHGLDVATAVAAANTQPFSHIHTPGLGVGGHCIPVYPYFLLQGDDLALPRRARAINDGMADYATYRLEAEMGSLTDCPVLILGVAYRGDVREHTASPAHRLRTMLAARGARVYAHDPLFSDAELEALGYTPFQQRCAAGVRAIVLQADHRAYQTIDFVPFTQCQVVLDGRRVLERERIEALGMRYVCIGDGQLGGVRA